MTPMAWEVTSVDDLADLAVLMALETEPLNINQMVKATHLSYSYVNQAVERLLKRKIVKGQPQTVSGVYRYQLTERGWYTLQNITMPDLTDPEAELVWLNGELAQLRQRQLEVVHQVGLAVSQERVLHSCLVVADEAEKLLDTIERQPSSVANRRKVLAMSSRVRRAADRLDRLKSLDDLHPGWEAANQALTNAGDRLILQMWPDT